MKFATLLTDFTDADGYPAVMKGVMLSITPEVYIVDLTHSIPPQDVLQAALLLGRSAPYFPIGTVHVCVVDPGVGTQRRGIIAQLGKQFFVGPDNGLMTLVYRKALATKETGRIYSLENPAYRLDPVSHSFHGRDVFAPAAAHFLNGTPLENFGGEITDPVLLHMPEPRKTENGWEGAILHIDAFGNLATTIRAEHLARKEKTHIILAGQTISGLLNTFGEGRQGDLVVIIDSDGYLSVCVVNGSAKQALDARVGDSVQVLFS
ncbi:MAG: SAM-dependent chlorinase/fluorinase [Pelolinea sp.]|nr:SAM-dependent chlorinase/fluorinase [Pelolinea sp.]